MFLLLAIMPRISKKRLPKVMLKFYIHSMKFQSPKSDLFFSKNDPKDPRLGEKFRFEPGANVKSTGIALLGYPDDEGIKNNGGRVGAKEGPQAIRHWLYRMTSAQENSEFQDLGDLGDFENSSLEARHEFAAKKVQGALDLGNRVVTLGGGHDYGFADGMGFLNSKITKAERPLVINFDAHLDVRDLKYGITSGTPFFRLKSLKVDFDLIQVGIQSQCNSTAHKEWCKANGVEILNLDEFSNSENSLLQIFTNRMSTHLTKKRPTFISVDIDGFAWPYAIGSSQSWPTGIEPREFFQLMNSLLEKLDVRLLSLYEVSPPLDVQGGTAKLAALIAHRFVEYGTRN